MTLRYPAIIAIPKKELLEICTPNLSWASNPYSYFKAITGIMVAARSAG